MLSCAGTASRLSPIHSSASKTRHTNRRLADLNLPKGYYMYVLFDIVFNLKINK